jgi:O-acetyl-ADP-ribose deacetylase
VDAKYEYLDGRVVAGVGDITRVHVDAVVNAANSTLLGGGGVDGAIHRAGGPAILAECRRLRRTRYPNGMPAGDAVATSAGELPARIVIHTVGPVWGEDADARALLQSCYRQSIALADEHALRSIAFPAISTGVFGYPRERAAADASLAIREALAAARSIRQVHLVFFAPDDLELFARHQQFGKA